MPEPKPKKPITSPKAKVFDVAPPSQNVASPTSRPVIVGHTSSIQKDPMVSPSEQVAQDAVTEAAKVPASKPKKELVLKPVEEDTPVKETSDTSDTPEASAADTETSVEPDTNETTPEAETETPPPAEAADDTTADENEVSADDLPADSSEETVSDDVSDEPGAGAVEALVAGVNTKKDRKDQEEKEAKRQQEVQNLIASKKYNVKTHLPPGKRNTIWLIVLVVVVLLAAAGWYLVYGPGRSLWEKKPPAQQPVAASVEQPKAETPKTETQTPASVVKTVEFNDPKYGLSFQYPSDWKVQTAKDKEFATRDVITLSSPVETIKVAGSQAAEQVDAEVFLRTRIVVENTQSPTEYASDLVNLASCGSDDIVAQTTALKLLYVDPVNKSPSVSQVSVGPSNCTAAGDKFTANDQIQLSKKTNTFIIYTQYVYSDIYLKKIGTTTDDAIALAQETGVSVSKDILKAGKNYQKFVDVIKSLKET